MRRPELVWEPQNTDTTASNVRLWRGEPVPRWGTFLRPSLVVRQPFRWSLLRCNDDTSVPLIRFSQTNCTFCRSYRRVCVPFIPINVHLSMPIHRPSCLLRFPSRNQPSHTISTHFDQSNTLLNNTQLLKWFVPQLLIFPYAINGHLCIFN